MCRLSCPFGTNISKKKNHMSKKWTTTIERNQSLPSVVHQREREKEREQVQKKMEMKENNNSRLN